MDTLPRLITNLAILILLFSSHYSDGGLVFTNLLVPSVIKEVFDESLFIMLLMPIGFWLSRVKGCLQL